MMTVQDKTSFPESAWDGWAPDWNGGKKVAGPHAQQEKHSPTRSAALRGLGGTQTRRLTDARLWEAMTGAQQDAALEIALSFTVMSRGLGYATSDWEKIPGSRAYHNAIESRERLTGFYTDWARRCHKDGVSHSMILDILVYGFSCRALDSDRRVRAGWSRRNLMKGLVLYCRMKGWPAA